MFRNYYHNEDFFHINRIYLCMDSEEANALLPLLPKFNICSNKPDFILIHNHKSTTVMSTSYKYIDIDYLIAHSTFGMSLEGIGLWDSFNRTDEEDEIAKIIIEKYLKNK